MSAERKNFRIIPNDEYLKLEENPDTRIKMDELEPGMLVEVYGTGPEFRRNGYALNFTSQVEITDLSQKSSVGHIGIKLLVISADLTPMPQFRYPAFAKPELPHAGAPLIWTFPRETPMRFPNRGNILHGFFSSWADSDASQLNETDVSLSEDTHRYLTLL